MYKILTRAEDTLLLFTLALFFGTVGQIVGILLPKNMIMPAGFLLCGSMFALCLFYRKIYDKGWNTAKIDQEPDEDTSSDKKR